MKFVATVDPSSDQPPKREMGRRTAAALAVGNMVGSGIFLRRTPAEAIGVRR